MVLIRYCLFCCTLLWGGIALCQGDEYDSAIKAFLDRPALEGASVTLCFLDEKGQEVIRHRPEARGIPGSSIKLVTAGFLWASRGADHQWVTRCGYLGEIDDQGVLHGDLIIRASGDPTLGSEYSPDNRLDAFFEELFHALQLAGIRKVNGGLLLDVGSFEDNPVPGSWPREDAGNYYGAGYWPLNVRDNAFRLCFDGREEGKRPVISSCEPELGLRWENLLVTGPPDSGDQAFIFGGPESDRKHLYGSVPSGEGMFCIKGAMPDPPGYFLDAMKDALMEEGIGTRYVGKATLPEDTQYHHLFDHKSPPLYSILPVNLQKSLNLYSDAFLFAIDEKHPPTWKAACSRLAGLLEGLVSHPQVVIKDGSGMSPANGISSRQLAMSLNHFFQRLPDWERFLSCLPRDGTRPIWLKSGSLSGVMAYSGYLRTRSGQLLSFSVMANQLHPDNRTLAKRDILDLLREIAAN